MCQTRKAPLKEHGKRPDLITNQLSFNNTPFLFLTLSISFIIVFFILLLVLIVMFLFLLIMNCLKFQTVYMLLLYYENQKKKTVYDTKKI